MEKAHQLTSRQKQILELKANGFLNKQICAQLDLTEPTIHEHLKRACKTLKAKNTAHAIALAVMQDLITITD